jgi:GGDEF domain-containing protein
MVGTTLSGGVESAITGSVATTAKALASVDPLADPLFPMSLLEARADVGANADPLPLLQVWASRARSQVGRIRYRWTISTWPSFGAVAHIPNRELWTPWRSRDIESIAEDRARFEERLITPLVIAEAVEWLSNLAEVESEAGDLARGFLAESRATVRRDAAAYAQELHAWGDTWALWCFARRPRALRLLHPFALAIAEAYADTTIATGYEAVHETRFPFAGVPLVSASAQLAGGCLALGVHPKLTGALTDWIKDQQRPDGGFGDGDGPSDVLTTLVAADLLAGLDPGWDATAAVAYLTGLQNDRGWWRAYGPESAWLTLEVCRFIERASLPFGDRFTWPEVATASRDRRTGLPRYDYYADLARLCQEVSGLGQATIEVAFLDLAGFGSFNNRHGMAMGDAVLREFGQALASIPGLMAIRDGGDEFLALGAPGDTGLAATLDQFRRDWPARLQASFGDDARVAPRILVATTTGVDLVGTRDDLGRRIADLKTADPVDGLPAEGVLVELTPGDTSRGGGR